MIFNKKEIFRTCACALFLGATYSATAVEGSANVTMATDYLFRGVSQTNGMNAIQGGFDIATDSGFYAGTWASNVDYGTDSNTEMDVYIGFAGQISEEVGYDVRYINFDYAGDSEFDYQEIALSIGAFGATFGVNYSSEYLGDGGPRFIYPYIDYSLALPQNISLDFHIGLIDLDEEGLFEPGEDSYMDYSIGIFRELGGIGFSLSYVDTSIDNMELAEGRVLFTVSKSL